MPKKSTSKIIKLKDESNIEIVEDKIADYVNNYFSTIGEVLADKHPHVDIPAMAGDRGDDIDLLHMHFETDDIITVLKEIDQTKSSNIKNIKRKVLCDIFKTFADKLLYIYNRCLSLAFFSPVLESSNNHSYSQKK